MRQRPLVRVDGLWAGLGENCWLLLWETDEKDEGDDGWVMPLVLAAAALRAVDILWGKGLRLADLKFGFW